MESIIKKELDLNGKIRNLQVSISIYLREAESINREWESLSNLQKIKKHYRLEILQVNISKKEQELFKLKEQKLRDLMEKVNISIPPRPIQNMVDYTEENNLRKRRNSDL